MAEILYIQDADLEDSKNESDTNHDADSSGSSDVVSSDSSGALTDSSGASLGLLGGSGGSVVHQQPGGGQDDWAALKSVHRLEKYATCDDTYTRQMSGRVLLEILRGPTEGFLADLDTLEAIVARLADDTETCVRMELVEQVPHAAVVCRERREPRLGPLVDETLLGVVIMYLRDPEDVVRKTAQAALLMLMDQGLIDRDLIENKVCPAVLRLSKSSETVTELYTAAVALMSKMAPLLGSQATERLFLERFLELCSEETFCVRKMCASSFGEFCAVIGRKSSEELLLPKFLKLCDDDIWGIRKACADVTTLVSFSCSPPARRSLVAPAFVSLLEDNSRWVRMSAFQNLGPFIATFASPGVTGLVYNQQGDLVLTSLGDGVGEWERSQQYEKNTLLINMLENSIDNNEQQNSEDGNNWSGDSITIVNSQSEQIQVYDETINTTSSTEKSSLNQQQEFVDMFHDYTPKLESTENVLNVPIVHVDGVENLEPQSFNKLSDDKQLYIDDASDTCIGDFYNNHFWYIPPAELDLRELQCDLSIRSDEKPDVNSSYISNISMCDDKTFCVESRESKPSVPPPGGDSQRQEVVPHALIQHFVSMVQPPYGAQLDNESSYHCAYSFPAVALTLGKSHWPLLKETYETLASDMQWKVRKTVASSLHELAEILGGELASQDLAPIFDAFIKDLDEVRIGVLKHMAQFFKTINHNERSQFLPRLDEFRKTDNCCNWRFRMELARQLLVCVRLRLFTARQCDEHLRDLVLELLRDKVVSVRRAAGELMAALVEQLSMDDVEDVSLASNLLTTLAGDFANSDMWSRRQTYVMLCGLLVRTNALPLARFEDEVLRFLLGVSWDPVANVRLVVARVLVEDILSHDYFSSGTCKSFNDIQIVLHQLQNDDDRDVRCHANSALPSRSNNSVNDTVTSLLDYSTASENTSNEESTINEPSANDSSNESQMITEKQTVDVNTDETRGQDGDCGLNSLVVNSNTKSAEINEMVMSFFAHCKTESQTEDSNAIKEEPQVQ